MKHLKKFNESVTGNISRHFPFMHDRWHGMDFTETKKKIKKETSSFTKEMIEKYSGMMPEKMIIDTIKESMK